MKKVICISHKDHTGDELLGKKPEIGEECEVIRTAFGYGYKNIVVPCFALAGYPMLHDQRNFALVSDIDETALLAECLDAEMKEFVLSTETAAL